MMRCALGVWLTICLALCCSAIEPSREPVEQSLRESSRSLWFDPEQVEIQPIELPPQQKDSLHRYSRWVPKPQSPQSTPTNTNNNVTGPSSTSTGSGTALGWTLLIIFGTIAAGLLIYAFLKIGDAVTIDTSSSSRSSDLNDDLAKQTALRIKELPSELRRENMDLKSEAQRLMNSGDLDEAIKCLFGYQLLLLDRHGFLRLSRGKTNNRYVSEVRGRSPDATSLLRATVDAFEASYFGKHTPSVPSFQRLWENNQTLESLTTTHDGAT